MALRYCFESEYIPRTLARKDYPMFYPKPKKRNGAYIGQSLHNERICVCQYDPEKEDFVWRWIKTPDFVREALEANKPARKETLCFLHC